MADPSGKSVNDEKKRGRRLTLLSLGLLWPGLAHAMRGQVGRASLLAVSVIGLFVMAWLLQNQITNEFLMLKDGSPPGSLFDFDLIARSARAGGLTADVAVLLLGGLASHVVGALQATRDL